LALVFYNKSLTKLGFGKWRVIIVLSSARGRGCAKNPVRDLAALVVLEERGVLEALSDAGSAGRDRRALLIQKNPCEV
jgi:hypothetical protein